MKIKEEIKSIIYFYIIFAFIWFCVFYKDDIVSKIIASSKIFLFLFLPGVILSYFVFKKEDPIFKISIGVILGILLNSLLYYVFSLFNVKLFISVYLSPIILIMLLIISIYTNRNKIHFKMLIMKIIKVNNKTKEAKKNG